MQWVDQWSYLHKKDQEGERKVHVSIFNFLREKDLLRYFTTYGAVQDISIKTYPGTNISRNFCYITFESFNVAEQVINYSPHLVANEFVHCQLSIRPIKQSKAECDGSASLNYDRWTQTAKQISKENIKSHYKRKGENQPLHFYYEYLPHQYNKEELYSDIDLNSRNNLEKGPKESPELIKGEPYVIRGEHASSKVNNNAIDDDLWGGNAAMQLKSAYHPYKPSTIITTYSYREIINDFLNSFVRQPRAGTQLAAWC